MNKLMIITDSNSGILQAEADQLGIKVVPMPFTINGEEYFEEISMSQEEFYKRLDENADVKTSQPSHAMLESLWTDLLKDYEEILYIPMSSGLSATCEMAKKYAQKYDGKVFVVDNTRISVAQKVSVFEAIALRDMGKGANEIKNYLEGSKEKVSIYITMGVLKYLKKGGRISPAAAMLGDMLNVKPILSSRGGAFEKFSAVLSLNQAKKKMMQKVESELETEFKDDYDSGKMVVSVAHTQNEAEALKFRDEIIAKFPKLQFMFVDPLSLSVACHIGPGALAICICVKNF